MDRVEGDGLALFDYDKKKMLRVLVGSSILLMILVVTYFSMIGVYIESIGNVSGVEALNEDIRGEAQRVFFKNMDESVFQTCPACFPRFFLFRPCNHLTGWRTIP